MMPMIMYNMIAEKMVKIPLNRRALSAEMCRDRKVNFRSVAGSETSASSVAGISTPSVRVSVSCVVGAALGSSGMMSTFPPLPCERG